MGLFERFPYTNFHELNAEWLIKKMKELDEAMETFKATESLKFADPIIWNITTQYQKSTIVLDPTGNAYLSVQPVPAGVQLNDEEYWLEIFNFTEYTRTANKNLTAHVETNTTRATAAYNVDDWLIWEDVLYRVTAAIAIDDALVINTNLVHFTVEDFLKAFITYANGLIVQYKNDIDASELAYRTQLAQDITTTTNSLQAQLTAAIAGVTVDSEVINARIGEDGITYSTLGDAIRGQIRKLLDMIYRIANKRYVGVPLQAHLNEYVIKSGTTISIGSSANYAYIEYTFNGTEKHMRVMCQAGSNQTYSTGYFIVDSNNDIIEQYNEAVSGYYWKEFDIPSGAVKIYVNNYASEPILENVTLRADEPLAETVVNVINDTDRNVFGTLTPGGIRANNGTWYNEATYDLTHFRTGFIKFDSKYDHISINSIIKPDVRGSVYILRYNTNYSFNAAYRNYYIRDIDIPRADFENYLFKFVIEVPSGVNPITEDVLNFSYYLDDSKNEVTKLTVSTYNIGHFMQGLSDVPEASSDDMLTYRNLIVDQQSDIIGLTETDPLYNTTDNISSIDAVYSMYKNYDASAKVNYTCNGFLSNYKLLNKDTFLYTYQGAGRREYFKADIMINNHIIGLFVTQLEWSDITTRRSQIDEIIKAASSYDRAIILGDFNPNNRVSSLIPPGEEDVDPDIYLVDYKKWTDAGFKLANCGYYGIFNTLAQYEGVTIAPWDNIITYGNIDIRKVSRIVNSFLEDHYPLIAELVIY